MIYTTGTIAVNGNTVTGTGTNFTAPGSLIRVGCTLIAMSTPVQVLQITSIDSATKLTVTPAASPALPAGTRYSILLSDSLSVDGLAQSIAETFTMYQRYMSGFADVMNATGDVTITINGQPVTVPGQKSLAKKGNNDDITSLSGLKTALSIAQGGTGSSKPFGDVAGSFCQGNDSRLGSIDGKSGGVVKGNIATATGDHISSRAYSDELSRVGGLLTSQVTVNGVVRSEARLATQTSGGLRQAGLTIAQDPGLPSQKYTGFVFGIDGNATAPGVWVSGSDERHKSNITTVKNALSAVLSFRGALYDIKDSGRTPGLIAQDVEKFCPEAVKNYGDRTFNDGTVIKDFKYLDTVGAAAAFHTEAIKEIFNLIELSLDNPDECRARIAAVKEMVISDNKK